MMRPRSSQIPWAWRAFLLWGSSLAAAGWVLSWLGQLNATGYGGTIALGIAATGYWWHREHPPGQPWISNFWRRRSRWQRRLPLGFLVLAALSLLGGLLYAPNNIDALAYRTPRVLHWLDANRWHWIACPYQRLNVRATGFEWWSAPLLALTRSDRALFLISLMSYLLLPGFVFETLRSAGVSRIQSWRWMWLFPTGYCFAVQAGGIANDLYGGSVSALAAALAWRARRSGGESAAAALRWSVLALAMATNAKTSNVLLAIPWLAVVWPALAPGRHRLGLALATALLGFTTSIGPTAWQNWRHCGDWTGAKAEYAWTEPPPFSAIIHNVLLWSFQNLLPPVNPAATPINAAVESALPESWKLSMDAFADACRRAYTIQELPSEEYAGLGACVSWWLILGAFLRLRHRAGWEFFRRVPGPGKSATLLAPWGALLIYGVKSAIQASGRILAPFYIWLLPVFLMPVRRDVLSRNGQRIAEYLVLTVAAVVLVLNPARPLFPVSWVAAWAKGRPPNRLLDRAVSVYHVFGHRAEVFAPLQAQLPRDVSTVGLITVLDPETLYWQPYGQRRVRHIPVPYAKADIERLQITWMVVNLTDLQARGRIDFDDWLRSIDGEVVHRQPIKLAVKLPPSDYAVVRIRNRR